MGGWLRPRRYDHSRRTDSPMAATCKRGGGAGVTVVLSKIQERSSTPSRSFPETAPVNSARARPWAFGVVVPRPRRRESAQHSERQRAGESTSRRRSRTCAALCQRARTVPHALDRGPRSRAEATWAARRPARSARALHAGRRPTKDNMQQPRLPRRNATGSTCAQDGGDDGLVLLGMDGARGVAAGRQCAARYLVR